MTAPPTLDRGVLRRAFDRHALASRSGASWIDREVARRLDDRLALMKLKPGRVVDLGAGFGACADLLGHRYPRASLIKVDFALEALRYGRKPGVMARAVRSLMRRDRHAVCAAIDALPLAARSAELVCANLVLQWLADPLPTLREAHRALEVGGLFTFSTLGPDSLRELRSAFATVDSLAHVHSFIDMHDLGDMLVGAGFADPVMEMEMLTLTYATPEAAIAELRSSGSACALADRPHSLYGARRWKRMLDAYRSAIHPSERLPLRIELVFGHAWKPQARRLADGSQVIKLERKLRDAH